MHRQSLLLIIALFSLFLLLRFLPSLVKYLTKASGQPADLVIDSAQTGEFLAPFWQALAQGGEEKMPFTNILPEIRALQPQYIRLDHLYDFYRVAQKNSQGQLIFNWSELDALVADLRAAGALPFFSLSYLPPEITTDGQITSPPADWNDWSQIVQKTIEHYSGKNQQNIPNVIYEVWNEPDLFGQWKIGRTPDYLQLYHYAALGAAKARNVHSFKLGGPATTAPYSGWVTPFLDYVQKNHLRLDFLSWHRYSADPRQFAQDLLNVKLWLADHERRDLAIFMTEWGSDPENSSWHDTNFDAAHLVASVRHMLGLVDLAFTFEIKDGPSPESQKYWGRWGLLTHQLTGSSEKKPKYTAFLLLNHMRGRRLNLTGEGDWITAFATQENTTLRLLVANLDPRQRHFENVPLRIINLKNGTYQLQQTYLEGINRQEKITITNNALSEHLPLTANNLVLLELTLLPEQAASQP
ncbi:MAG: hypothetical protein ABH807_03160 [Candidatus Shapirobacteria bacterium]